MSALKLAQELAGRGFYVFPVKHGEDNSKTPLTKNGHLDATIDPYLLEDWWDKFPHAKVGVAAGESGIVVADIDVKNGHDGFDSLDNEFLDLPETFTYTTGTGGSHFVYLAPEGVELNGQADYRKMDGVDRRAGSSWVLWAGDVPAKGSISPAPEWLCDPATERKVYEFEGALQEWFETLVPGEPNLLVRRAIERLSDDMSHSEMVEAQHSAIRLGAEGNPGVPDLLDAIQEAWEARPAENHTTPEEMWGFKFQEALASGLEKYGGLTEQLQNLPEYSINLVPSSIPASLVTTPGGKPEFSQLLGKLVDTTQDDNLIAAILWGAPATRELAREWGLQFVHQRIQSARTVPEPKRENPRVEEHRERQKVNTDSLDLLSEQERGFLSTRPTFVDHIEEFARDMEYDQLPYFRSIAWTMLSLTLGLRGFVPVSGSQRHGLNLWNITVGWSGTGKSVTIDFRDQVLRIVFGGDSKEMIGYDLGADSSVEGLHTALLERDGEPSLFATDEASGFFKKLKKNDWMSGLEDTLSAWYMGFVAPSNKVRLKELRGKSARTSFNMQMFATPDRLTESITRDQFSSGFMARVCWVIGNPPVETDERFDIFKIGHGEVEERVDAPPAVIQEVAADLLSVKRMFPKAVNLSPSVEAQRRLSEAYKRMYRLAENRENFDIVEPSITRLMEAMVKCAGLCAMYRGDTEILEVDALHSIRAVEEWFRNLFEIADMVSSGDFQRDCDAIEAWIIAKGGKASRSELFYRFRNMIQRDKRELENRVDFLTESGIINREEANGGIRYTLNGYLEKKEGVA